jgi:protein required for attachment to host cells
MSTIWTVVADASRARIFQGGEPGNALREIITLAHPESRLHEGDLVSDRSGHDMDSTTGGHGVGRGHEHKDDEANHFAKEVCQRLEQGQNEGSYSKLYVIAAPAFLGLLRQHMAKPVQGLISDEIAKELTTADDAQIREHLPEHM